MDPNAKFFKDAWINDKHTKAYVDFGSTCITIRNSEVQAKHLKVDSSKVINISGYGGGAVATLGTTKFVLKIDNVELLVEAYVVSNSVQIVPLLVGQPFTEHPTVRVIKDSHTLDLQKVTASLKTTLFPLQGVIIPRHHCGHIEVEPQEPTMGEYYIASSIRSQPGKEYMIPRCVVALNKYGRSFIPIINLSDFDIEFREQQSIARATLCLPEKNEQLLSITTTKKWDPLPEDEIIVGTSDVKIKAQLIHLLNKYRQCFAQGIDELGSARSIKMKIELTNKEPFYYRPYRLASTEKEQVTGIINDLLAQNIIQESTSNYASPILLVRKKGGEQRMCIDYRKLNSKTLKEHYPLPLIDDTIDALNQQKYFTAFDLSMGYHQIPMDSSSKKLTAFVTPEGHYEYNRMPFGLSNAPSVFQRLMNHLFLPHKDLAVVYLDDILISSKTVEKHFEKIEKVLKILNQEGLTLKLKKCSFFMSTINYLGFQVSQEGIRPGEEKIKAVINFPTPQDVHQVRQFVGLISYFRRFVKRFGELVRPLTKLTHKNQKWVWGQEQQKTFNMFKHQLVTRPILALYNPKADTEIHCDASANGLAGILMQKGADNCFHPVHYFSRQTSKTESRYHSYELEALAVVESLKKFRVYLLGKPFKVITDCSALTTAISKKELVPRIARWWLFLQDYNFEVKHRPGTQMKHVDALSRNLPQVLRIERPIGSYQLN